MNEVDSVLSTIWTGVYQPGKTAPSTQTSKGPLLSGCSGQDMITSISSLGAFTDCFWFGIGVLDGSNGATTPFAGAYGAWSFPDQSVEFMVYSTATAPFAGAANMAVALYQNVLTFDTLENYFEGDLTAILKSEAKAGFKAYTGQDAGYDNFGASCGTLV